MRRVFADELIALAERDPRIVVLDNDSDSTTETARFRQRFPQRFYQMGIAEKNIFGTAAGMATTGLTPFPTVFATMAVRCALDQIAISICYANLGVKIPGHYVGGSKAGASHIPVEDIAVMRALPNMRVADPGDAAELQAIMREAVATEGPVYFRVSKLAHEPLPGTADVGFTWGKGRILRHGSDVTLFGTGLTTAFALKAADLLAEEGIAAEVVHLSSIKPIDAQLIAESTARTGAAVSVENASVIGGLGSAVAEVLAEYNPVRMIRLGYQDVWAHSGAIEDLLDHHGLRATAIAGAARRVLKGEVALA
jgi:transketolase